MHDVDKYLATLSSEPIPDHNPAANRKDKWRLLMDQMGDGESVEMTKREYNSFYQATTKAGHTLRWRTTEYKTNKAPSGASYYSNESIGRAYLYRDTGPTKV